MTRPYIISQYHDSNIWNIPTAYKYHLTSCFIMFTRGQPSHRSVVPAVSAEPSSSPCYHSPRWRCAVHPLRRRSTAPGRHGCKPCLEFVSMGSPCPQPMRLEANGAFGGRIAVTMSTNIHQFWFKLLSLWFWTWCNSSFNMSMFKELCWVVQVGRGNDVPSSWYSWLLCHDAFSSCYGHFGMCRSRLVATLPNNPKKK